MKPMTGTSEWKKSVTETNATNDGNQWLKEATDGNQWNQWRKPVTETNETNDGNQWRKYIISMLPMITTGFGYGYSLRHSSVVSAFTAHTLTNSFVNHPPPHPSGCGYNMKSHSELHWKIKVTNIQYSFPNLVSWDPPTIASEQT